MLCGFFLKLFFWSLCGCGGFKFSTRLLKNRSSFRFCNVFLRLFGCGICFFLHTATMVLCWNRNGVGVEACTSRIDSHKPPTWKVTKQFFDLLIYRLNKCKARNAKTMKSHLADAFNWAMIVRKFIFFMVTCWLTALIFNCASISLWNKSWAIFRKRKHSWCL